jgi:hypothetical protein
VCGDLARDFRPEEEEGVGADSRGPHVSEVRGRWVTGSGIQVMGPWASSGYRPNGLPRPSSPFPFFLFFFSFCDFCV